MATKTTHARNIASEHASRESGGLRPRTPHFVFKLLIFIVYGAGQLSYVRRDRHIFNVWRRPLCIKFKKKSGEIIRAFRSLEEMQYIYNLKITGQDARFAFNPPAWLTFSELEKKQRSPIANPAFNNAREVERTKKWLNT